MPSAIGRTRCLGKLAGLLCASLLVACAIPTHRVSNYPVLIHAYDDGAKPLPGVQLSAAGRELGSTETTGARLLTMQGTEGQRIDLTATCPAGYDGPRARPALVLRRVQSLPGSGVPPIEVSVTCDAREHVSLVAIRTGHAGIPIKLRGQAVALTSSTGSAHVLLRDAVGSSFQLTLDTSASSELRPANPTRMFAVTGRDAFTLWDQPFEQDKKSPARGAKKKWKRKTPETDGEPPALPPPPPENIPETP
jgi:hypothetical protein